MEEVKLFVAGKAFIVYKKKVLIIRESTQYSEGTHAGKFDLPGGRLKPGERLEESMHREIFEETGLKMQIGKPLFVNESMPIVKNEKWQIIRIFYMCVAETDKVLLSKDHDSYEWIIPSEYKKYSIIENLHPIFEEYLKQEF